MLLIQTLEMPEVSRYFFFFLCRHILMFKSVIVTRIKIYWVINIRRRPPSKVWGLLPSNTHPLMILKLTELFLPNGIFLIEGPNWPQKICENFYSHIFTYTHTSMCSCVIWRCSSLIRMCPQTYNHVINLNLQLRQKINIEQMTK